MEKFISQYKIPLLVFFVLSSCYFIFFNHLTSFPIFMWDESRQAVSAFEMIQNKKIFVNYFEGRPDMWSTKPPLFIWLVALSMKCFGYNLLALRLPSALLGTATCLLLLFLGYKYLKSLAAGILMLLVLMTSWGYIGYHVARTADYDVLLVFCTTLYAVSFFKYLFSENATDQKKQLLLFYLGVILSVLTKNIAGLMLLPGMFVFVLTNSFTKKVFTDKRIYYYLIASLLPLAVFYYLRESQNPGFIKAFVENEITGRFFTSLENHKEPFDFYWNNLFRERLPFWIYLLPLSFLVMLFSRDQSRKRISMYAMTCMVIFFLVISKAQTKLPWYDAPIYPFCAIIIGLGFYELFLLLSGQNHLEKIRTRFPRISFLVFLFIVFFFPFKTSVEKIQAKTPDTEYNQIQYGRYLPVLEKKFPEMKKFPVLNIDYNAHLLFYKYEFSTRGKEVDIIDESQYQFHPGDTIITCRENLMFTIESHYEYTELDSKFGCKTYLLKNRK